MKTERLAPPERPAPAGQRPGLPHRLLPKWTGNGREAFQLRFLIGACLLAAPVAVASLVLTVTQGASLESAILGAFLAADALLLVAIRLGVRVGVAAWTALATVGTFLVAMSLMTRELQVGQIPWFLLLPLSAMVLVGPRADDPAGRLRPWPIAIAMLVALAAVVFVVVAHQVGLTFDQPATALGPWATVLDFALLLASAVGLVFLYDHSARETHAELQQLRRLLSICAWCRKIDHEGSWIPLEQYLTRRHHSALSHGICPGCFAQQVPPDGKGA